MAVPFLMSCELIILPYYIMYYSVCGRKGSAKERKNQIIIWFFPNAAYLRAVLPRKGTTIFEKIIKLSIKFSIFLWYFEKYE
jgi:hypothetical protein